jgi:psiF repeat
MPKKLVGTVMDINMLRLFVSASIFVIVLGLAGLPARAQSSSDATSKSLRVAQAISPTQQEEQRAAKSVACRKQAKEQKLSGSERSAFLKDCIRKDGGAEAAKLSDAEKVALEKAMASCKEEAKGMKFKWHWRKRQKYVQNCILRSASQQGIDIWEIRRAVNMKELPRQDIDDWSFVFSRSRNR